VPRILDNISLDLVSALKNTLAGSCSVAISVGYFNLRGWRFLDAQMENFPGGEGHCCRLIVGMQRSPQEGLRRSLSLLKNGERLSNKEVNRLIRVATEEFREQLQIGAPTDAEEKGLRRLSAQLRAKKLLVRLYLREPLHAKLYLIHRDDPNLPAVGFVGSSNLTPRVCTPPDFAELLARVGAPLVPVGQPVRPMVHGATPPTAADLPRRAVELVAAQFDTVAAVAEGCDALAADGMMPAGVWL